jgi:hypothetical protein
MDVVAMARAAGKIATVLLMFVARELRRLALWYFLGGELIFVGYSLFKLVTNGPGEVFHWWAHLQSMNTSLEHLGDPFSWGKFIIVQLVILVLATVLLFFELRYQRRLRLRPR